jgi:hypothetical protein
MKYPPFPAWPKTKQGATRQIDAILRDYHKDFEGGGTFGWDWITFRLNSPERYERVRALQKLWHELPFRDGTRIPR